MCLFGLFLCFIDLSLCFMLFHHASLQLMEKNYANGLFKKLMMKMKWEGLAR